MSAEASYDQCSSTLHFLNFCILYFELKILNFARKLVYMKIYAELWPADEPTLLEENQANGDSLNFPSLAKFKLKG